MRKIMDIAISDDIINKNYAEYVTYETDEAEIARNLFTPDEIKSLWEHKNQWLMQIILIMLYSGARIAEVINIKSSDVNLEENYFHITAGKNKFAVRDVPIHPALFELFNDLCNNTSDYIIKDENGANLRAGRVYSSMERIIEVTGTEHYVYDAKHTFITQCEICKVRELYKINIIGHTPKNTSGKVYTHLPISEFYKEIRKVSY